MNEVHLLSANITQDHNFEENSISQILSGQDQLSLMSLSARRNIANVQLHAIVSEDVKLPKDFNVSYVKQKYSTQLTLDILKLQRDYFFQKGDAQHWIVCDPDLLFFKDISAVFNQDFDIAFTVRSSSTMPHNSGIFFIKNQKDHNFAEKFFNDKIEIIEKHLKENSGWFADQLVLKWIIDRSTFDENDGLHHFNGYRILLLDGNEYNYSPNREHPNILRQPTCSVYHFKGRCRSYMKYFKKYYLDTANRPFYWRLQIIIDFVRSEIERKKYKKFYKQAVKRHKPRPHLN